MIRNGDLTHKAQARLRSVEGIVGKIADIISFWEIGDFQTISDLMRNRKDPNRSWVQIFACINICSFSICMVVYNSTNNTGRSVRGSGPLINSLALGMTVTNINTILLPNVKRRTSKAWTNYNC